MFKALLITLTYITRYHETVKSMGSALKYVCHVKLHSSETDLRIVQQSLINITKTFKTKLKVEPFISDPHETEM